MSRAIVITAIVLLAIFVVGLLVSGGVYAYQYRRNSRKHDSATLPKTLPPGDSLPEVTIGVNPPPMGLVVAPLDAVDTPNNDAKRITISDDSLPMVSYTFSHVNDYRTYDLVAPADFVEEVQEAQEWR
jgi:hypothetical protein